MTADLQIQKLSKTYPNGVQALKDVTLTIPPGMYGLLGPNGAPASPRSCAPSPRCRTCSRLFEKVTLWDLRAKKVRAEPTAKGEWRITLDAVARKVAVDGVGAETEVPMDDWVEIGVFAPPRETHSASRSMS